jgi:hypothetical protein
LSPYAINKLIFDLTPDKLNCIKENQMELEQYKLSPSEKNAIREAIYNDRFKGLAELGVLPNLLFRLARLCGYGPGQFAELMKE